MPFEEVEKSQKAQKCRARTAAKSKLKEAPMALRRTGLADHVGRQVKQIVTGTASDAEKDWAFDWLVLKPISYDFMDFL